MMVTILIDRLQMIATTMADLSTLIVFDVEDSVVLDVAI
jgi:hypothetical protein